MMNQIAMLSVYVIASTESVLFLYGSDKEFGYEVDESDM